MRASRPVSTLVPDEGATMDAATDAEQPPTAHCDLHNFGWVELRGASIGAGDDEAGEVQLPQVTVVDDGGFEVRRSFPAPLGRPKDGIFVEVRNAALELRCWVASSPTKGRTSDGTTISLTPRGFDNTDTVYVAGSERLARPGAPLTIPCLDHGESGYLAIPLQPDVVEVLVTLTSRPADTVVPPSACIAPRSYAYADGQLSIELANEGDMTWSDTTLAAELMTLSDTGKPLFWSLALAEAGPLEPGETGAVVAALDAAPESTRLLVRVMY